MEQTEYFLGYALTFAMILLGTLVVCIPRPRKAKFLTPDEERKQKQRDQKRKAQAKKQKTAKKSQKKKAKAAKKAR